MGDFSADSVYNALLVLLAICGAITTIGKALEVVNSWRKPGKAAKEATEETLQAFEKRFEKGERRMGRIEADLDDFHDGQFHMCMCIKALIGHELHNGNTQEMLDASSNMDKWLAKRR